MDNEILRAAARKRGASDAAQEAAEVAVELDYPRKRVRDALVAPRSTIYAREGAPVRCGTA